MRCTSCGFPISPSRTNTNCPRCGTASGTDQQSAAATLTQQYEETSYESPNGVQFGSGLPPQRTSWRQPASDAQVMGYSQGALTPSRTPARDAPTLPPQVVPYTPQQVSSADQMWQQGPGLLQQPPPQYWQPKPSAVSNRNTRLGFTVAALCVITGGLILLFVYFLAIGSGGSSTTNNSAGAGNTQAALATATQSASTPSATSTASPSATTFPGQQYIDNAQMASAIDTKTSKATQLSTTFKTNQNIYVTFQVHPAGHTGAVCLLWYLNGKQATQYNFAVSKYTSASYSYAIFQGTGAGYVDIYWASSTACTDQIQAQHATFTVTA